VTLFIQNDATGAGVGTVQAALAFTHLSTISNFDTGLGLGTVTGNLQQVTYARTDPGIPPTRLDALVNTNFAVNPAGTDIIIFAVGSDFTLIDGSLITTRGGTALPPAGSGMPGDTLNTTASCLVIYDTTDNNANGYCLARQGTGGTMDLRLPLSVMAYHEFSHAFRIVNNNLLALTNQCNPSSPEENAAITDENDMRTQLATFLGEPVVLRDAGIHCGQSCGGGGGDSCCIVASVTSGSPLSAEVAALRTLRDQFFRRSEVGHAFFESLHYAYYAFSPQVVGQMATDADLRSTVLDGLVRPLIKVLNLVRDYAIDGVSAPELGARFLRSTGSEDDVARSRRALERATALVSDADADDGAPRGSAAATPGATPDAGAPHPATGHTPTPTERTVRDLLVERALPDPHIRWALVEPVLAYFGLLEEMLDGEEPATLGDHLVEFISEWAGRLPLDSRWGVLDTREARAELRMLRSTLLRHPRSLASVLARLEDEFGAATGVRAAVDEARAEGSAS